MSNLNSWLALILGFILGYLLAWYLGRNRQRACEERAASLEEQLRAQSNQLQDARNRLSKTQAETAELEAKLKAIETAPPRVEASLPAPDFALAQPGGMAGPVQAMAFETLPAVEVVPSPPSADDLTRIKGIGPKFAASLAASGFTTYDAMAQADPDQLAAAVKAADWQQIDYNEWIVQAQTLATQPKPVQVGDDLLRLEGIGPTYDARLRVAGIVTYAQLAAADETALAGIINAPPWRRVNYGDWIAQAKLAAAGDEAGLQALQAELFSRKGDNLALIQGLGEKTVGALSASGIDSYAALAAASPDQLRDIVKQAGVRGGDYEAWIAEARLRAAGKRVKHEPRRRRSLAGATEASCPQDLSVLVGIGAAYEQKLYAAGIGSYWELAQTPNDELATILEVQDFQAVDLDAIKADATRMAAETGTVGRVWDGTPPDDFEILEGIGEVYERRLYEAGICTFRALAAAGPERLAEICKAPAFRQPNYGRWIEQAREQMA